MAPLRAKSAAELPWAERHRPCHLGQVVGNTDQVRKLAEWLRDWDDVVLKGKKKEQPVPEQGKEWKWRPPPDNINARAALITGPPGIGKTTTCTLVAKCNPKYSVKEYNASDARSKKIVEQMSNSLAGNMTLSKGGLERSCIIMDECDGMAGGGDSGGTAALIDMIKKTKNPIICICNDRGASEVRKLAAECLDIKFRRPDNSVVAKRIKRILEGEGRKVDLMAIESIVEACGHDIRQVLNQVQFFGTVTAHAQGSQKDTQNMGSPFDACSKLLTRDHQSRTPLTFDKKMDLFYIDLDLMPMMVQENYLRTYEKTNRNIDADELSKCAYAAELIATADGMGGDFSLTNNVAAIGTLYPAFLTAEVSGFPRPTFPAWLQKRAPMNKNNKLAQEMHARVRPFTTCSSRDMVTSGYHDVLYRRLLRPLSIGDVKTCAVNMHSYGLSREFFTDQAPALRVSLQMDDPYKRVDGKNKSQLLTELNELNQQAQQLKRKAGESGGGAKRKRKSAGGQDTGDGGDEAVNEDDDDVPGLKQTQKKKSDAKKEFEKRQKRSADTDAKCSLGGWVKKEEKLDENGNVIVPPTRKTGILLKFIEGHTVAVRRKVSMEDVFGPWRLF